MTVLRIDNLSKTYSSETGTVRALYNVSLEIRRGDFVAITGPSGSGKSTLLHLMGGLDIATDGDIHYSKNSTTVSSFKSISERDMAVLRGREIGIMYQGFHLLPTMQAWENVALPLLFQKKSLKERKRLAEEALVNLGLSHRGTHYPSQLSGGEQQRVALARAVVSKPTLLLADEPTGNLDSSSAEEVLNLLQRTHENYGLTTVIVTHDERVARFASRTITIVDGRNYENRQTRTFQQRNNPSWP